VAKRLADIKKQIEDKADEFSSHLDEILSDEVLDIVRHLQAKTKVYLFSGVIRNYFLKRGYDLRDIDFIIEDDLDIEKLFPNLYIRQNSFGGYKIKLEYLYIDLWVLNKTWGLNQGQPNLPFDELERLERLPETTFFNFSSILFLMNEKKFITRKPFLRFLRDKKLDVVLEENPYPALCIVNSFYYADKFRLKLSNKLKQYIIEHYNDNIDHFDNIQLKHFDRIIYKKKDLQKKLDNLQNFK
jgi:hypothetical protein